MSGNDYEQCQKYFKKALDKSPSFKAAYEGMGICHTELGEHDQALACFNRFLELDPGDN